MCARTTWAYECPALLLTGKHTSAGESWQLLGQQAALIPGTKQSDKLGYPRRGSPPRTHFRHYCEGALHEGETCWILVTSKTGLPLASSLVAPVKVTL